MRLARAARLYDDGRTIVGGSPTRVLRLTSRAHEALAGGTIRVQDGFTRTLADRLLERGLVDPDTRGPALAAPGAADITVVVPVRDRPLALERLLSALGDELPVIVVDDGSERPRATAAVVARHDASLLALPANAGPAAARNAGLEEVSTPFVAFVDSDVVCRAADLRGLLGHFADPRVALVGPRIRSPRRDEKHIWVAGYESVRSSLDLGPTPSGVQPRSIVGWLPSACLVARVSALGDGFTAAFRSGEDVDLVWRLVRDGWRVRYEPGIVVEHDSRVGLRSWLARKAFYGTSAAPLAVRHGHDVAPAVLTPWSSLVVLALLAQRRWSLPVAVLLESVVVVRIARRVPEGRDRRRISARLVKDGTEAALWQASGLLLRHWWPITAAACCVSTRARRVAAFAGIVGAAVEHRRLLSPMGLLPFTVMRRLDDVAYGAGVWLGAVKGRSARALLPEIRFGRHRAAARPQA